MPNDIDVLAVATAIGVAAPAANVPAAMRPATMAREPTMLPANDTAQLRRSWRSVARPSHAATVSSAVLPVNSSEPVTTTMSSPNGSPTAPNRNRCRPGLDAARPGQAPPTTMASAAPNAMKQPARTPPSSCFHAGAAALAAPPSTACGFVCVCGVRECRWVRVQAVLARVQARGRAGLKERGSREATSLLVLGWKPPRRHTQAHTHTHLGIDAGGGCHLGRGRGQRRRLLRRLCAVATRCRDNR